MELGGRARHPAQLGDRDEGFQDVQVHLAIRRADVSLQNYADEGRTANQMTASALEARSEIFPPRRKAMKRSRRGPSISGLPEKGQPIVIPVK
jgi:hypothetical protein